MVGLGGDSGTKKTVGGGVSIVIEQCTQKGDEMRSRTFSNTRHLSGKGEGSRLSYA